MLSVSLNRSERHRAMQCVTKEVFFLGIQAIRLSSDCSVMVPEETCCAIEQR